jgi:hypothetical protein
MKVPARWLARLLVLGLLVSTALLFLSVVNRQRILAEKADLLAASRRFPNYTMAQRMGVLRALQSEKHPRFRDLSMAERLRMLFDRAMSSSLSSQPPAAELLGNRTVISINPEDVLVMARQPNCSLTLRDSSYNLMLPSVNFTLVGSTPNYDQILHAQAGLTTKGGKFAAGCGDPSGAFTSRKVVYAGKTKGGFKVYADTFYNGVTNEQNIETVVTTATTDERVSSANITGLNAVNLAAADLNKDGNPDLITVNDTVTESGSASISVLIGNAEGTFKAPVSYTLPGDVGVSAVIDDFNGDGIPDIVASSQATGVDELSFLEGNGDGTFKAAKSVKLKPPTGIVAGDNAYFGLISADLRGNGKKDLVTAAGIILFGYGNGTFAQSSKLVYTSSFATSEFGPNVVAADFNKDGKIDLAFDNGESIGIYLGKGDGTFTAGEAYGTINNTGYLTATDLDGDGNIDLYSGVSGPGEFGGDQFEFGQGYALMGNGDGTFRGAAELPFAFTGLNVVDLNHDKVPDGVGLNSSGNAISFTSYLGNGKGGFTPKSTLSLSSVKIDGTSYPISGVSSFAFGDVRDNGETDLIFLPTYFSGPKGEAGLFVAMGNGEGTFASPIFVPAPSFVKSGDDDYNEQLTNLFVADFNHDGKADIVYNYSDEGYFSHTYYEGIAVQLGNGDGTFQAPKVIQTYSGTTQPSQLGPMPIQIGDVNRDGFPDLFVLDPTQSPTNVSTKLQLYLGKGNGTFEAPLSPPVANQINLPSFGSAVGQVVLADMNDDGVPDLITLGSSATGNEAQIAISLGRGNGSFYAPSVTNFGGGGSLGYGLAVGDFNGDGKLDVVVTGFNPPFDTGVFLGRGDGTLETYLDSSIDVTKPSQAINLLVFGPSLAIDMNGDGKTDLIAGSAVLLNLATDLKETRTELSASAADVVAKHPLTLTAKVTGSGTVSGYVTFRDGAVVLGKVALKDGEAAFSTTSLAVGRHLITAEYDGSASFAASASAQTSVTVTASNSTMPIALTVNAVFRLLFEAQLVGDIPFQR